METVVMMLLDGMIRMLAQSKLGSEKSAVLCLLVLVCASCHLLWHVLRELDMP